MNDRTLAGTGIDDERLAELIRRGGARAQPAPAARAAAEQAVRAEWRQLVARRRRQQATRWSVAVAAAVVVGVAVWVAAPLTQQPGVAMASVARVSGPVVAGPGGWLAADSALAAGTALAVGDEVRSATGGRAALEIGGASLRLDEQSEIVLVAADRIALRRGAVYVDTGTEAASARSLVIETPVGTVEHLGTQYETRLAGDAVRVTVREGRVRMRGAGPDIDGSAGERLTVQRTGDTARQPVGAADAAWAWVGAIAPGIDIENRPLPEFLRWVGRETGREIGYSSAAAEQAAQAVVLRGSVAGLTPEQALSAVLATTDFDYQQAPGRVLIGLKR